MTQLIEPADNASDVAPRDLTVGRNTFRPGAVLPARPGDDSLKASQRQQHPVPPNSLTWKYFRDQRCLLNLMRLGGIENMWPQLGQGVSDHSQVFTDKGGFLERAARSTKIIASIVYAPPDEAKKYAVQIRNYHKSIKGDMPEGHTYHAINAETYYWAHVTFFQHIYNWVDHFGRRPLTRAEKEQIFEESKEWYSMYGVDERAQPETYDEFVDYFDDVINNQLVDSSVAQYSWGFASKPLPAPPDMNPVVAKLVWPRVVALLRLATVGTLEPVLRQRLDLRWTEVDQKNFGRFCKVMRAIGVVYDRLPMKYRYDPIAVTGFEREGIDPNKITVETAREALAMARAQYESV